MLSRLQVLFILPFKNLPSFFTLPNNKDFEAMHYLSVHLCLKITIAMSIQVI